MDTQQQHRENAEVLPNHSFRAQCRAALSRQLVSAVGRYGKCRGRKEGRQTGELYKEIRSVQIQGH